MATYQIQGPGGAVYQVDGPDSADPSALVKSLSGTKPTNASDTSGGGLLRDVALAGRSVGEGVFNALMAPRDLGTSLVNLERKGVNKLLGTNLQPSPMYSDQLAAALTKGGAPVPASSGEQLAAAGIRGASGALTGLGLFGGAGIPNAIRAGTAGLSGGVSSELAKQAGVGPVGQFATGVLGGSLPSIAEGALGVARTLTQPLTRAGQQQFAANALVKAASNPQAAAANLDTASAIVPGSMRTAGEASGDQGVLALEKGVRAQNPGAFAARISEQNAARQTELTNLGGTKADIAAAKDAREQTTGPAREQAMQYGGTANVRPVQLQIDRMLASPAGQRDIPKAALTWLQQKLAQPDDVSNRFSTPSQLAKQVRGTFEPRNPENLYAIRQDINDAMDGKLGGDLSKFKLARSQLLAIRSTLDDQIEAAAPGFKAYLKSYRDQSAPIGQMTTIQDLQQRASSGLDTTSGQPFLSSPMFSKALANAVNGRRPPQFTADQSQRLQALQQDLQRGSALSSPTIRTPGSDTFQNFMTGQRLGGGLAGRIPVVGKYLRGVNDFVDQRVNEQLAQAMLDPKFAAKLLRSGRTPAPLKAAIASGFAKYAIPGAVGSFSARQPQGLLSSQ